jgi:hypothetical protein
MYYTIIHMLISLLELCFYFLRFSVLPSHLVVLFSFSVSHVFTRTASRLRFILISFTIKYTVLYISEASTEVTTHQRATRHFYPPCEFDANQSLTLSIEPKLVRAHISPRALVPGKQRNHIAPIETNQSWIGLSDLDAVSKTRLLSQSSGHEQLRYPTQCPLEAGASPDSSSGSSDYYHRGVADSKRQQPTASAEGHPVEKE